MRRLLIDAEQADKPGLYVARGCEYFWRTVPYLARDQKRVEDVDRTGPDHGADACRYGLLRPKSQRSSDAAATHLSQLIRLENALWIVRIQMRGGGVLLRFLTVIVCRARVFFRFFMLAMLMKVRGLQVVVRSGGMVCSGLVMMLSGGMGRVGSHKRSL